MRDISELINIVSVINSDEDINSGVLEQLQYWADKNRNIVYETDQQALVAMVESVVSNSSINEDLKEAIVNSALKIQSISGSVTSDERKSVSDLSNDADDQFERKIDYLCELVKKRKIIGVELIDLLNSSCSISEIHKRAEKQLLTALMSLSGTCPTPEIVVISLALIGMLEYDGSFYDSVRVTYRKVYDRYSEQKVEGQIRSILSRYKSEGESGSRSRIINVALENSIVPKNYLPAFFEFIFDIYKINFDYDLPEEVYEEFQFVYEGLRSVMLSDEDDISINLTQKTYKLVVSTKHLIIKEDGLDALIKLSSLIVKLIDSCYWDKEVKIFNPYLKFGFDTWSNQIKEKQEGKASKRESVDSFRSRWIPKFLLDNYMVTLVPPAHRVKSQYNYRELEVVVYNGDDVIHRESNCDIREIFGGYQIIPRRIVLNRPLGALRYTLMCGDEVIYDSKDKLFRDYIVFNEDGQEISNNTDYEGTVFICYNDCEAELSTIRSYEEYKLGSRIIRIGDAIQFNDDVFNFSSIIKPGVIGVKHENCLVVTEEEKALIVYKEVTMLVIETDGDSNKFEIVINNKSYKLSEMKYRTTARNNITKYVVELGIDKSDRYIVIVYKLSGGDRLRILKDDFVCDKELEYIPNKINESRFYLHLDSGLINKHIETEITVADENPGVINFEYKGDSYKYYLPLDLGFYSINDDDWNSSTTDLWIDDIDIDSKMKLYDAHCDGLLVYSDSGILVEDNVAIINNGPYKELQIGFLKSYKANNKYVWLVFTTDGRKKYVIFCYNKCVIDKDQTEIRYCDDTKSVIVTPVFHGKNKVFFEIVNEIDKTVYKSQMLKSGQTESVTGLAFFEKYKFNFHEKTSSMLLRTNSLIGAFKRSFYCKDGFIGRTIKIDAAYYSYYVGNKCVEKEALFNNTYLRITGKSSGDLLRGQIFIKNRNKEWIPNRINPVEIEICSDSIDDTVDVYITNSGDGLLIDIDAHEILNTLEHKTAPDIFLYTLNLKESLR